MRTTQNGKGLTLRHSFARSSVGPVLAAFTDNGLCSLEFGESQAALIQALADRFPEADLLDGSPELDTAMATLIAFLQAPENKPDISLDLQGTDFQKSVWRELMTIPFGQTRTYSDIAEALGIPDSVRAVASACARNRVAVIVPCHRVLRKDGTLGGYYWGLEKKKALLKNEGC